MSTSDCYKSDTCKEAYCIERLSVCYKTAECNYDYCVDPATNEYQKMTNNGVLEETALIRRLGFLDRFLVVWILLAMIIGVIIGVFAPNVQESFETVQFGSVSVPIAIGLLVMMYPVLCKIQYERLHIILQDRKIWVQILISIVINWIIGPIIMTALAWACLPDLPGFRTGVVMVGLARCIAMVLIWNTLSGGDENYCAILVAINSILQIALFSPYAMLFINIVPSWFGAPQDTAINVDIWPVAQSVLIYLGIPLVAGFITRFSLRWLKGDKWYNEKFLPHFGPLALVGLIYTIIVMFANQGHHIIDNIGSVFRVAVPLFCYFIIMFFIPFFVLKMVFHFPYEIVVTQSFTAGSNNFELAIAVAVGTYGINSEQALAATIGPLIEVPVLVILVYVTLYFKKKLDWKKNHPDVESIQHGLPLGDAEEQSYNKQ
ncbi:ACR3 family arsenite transporter [Mucor circinelloides 1006PhL]|uniref:ACR3 family arsenite transporter n=1 Tax=Mucor circinelloides f. circinelloides (strain 1006PhL) TaxID=1220926 RepID=S2IU00_MUCC1|nr:ACR3 family arsenite transporter [Mucor circinelloides 1006PhL]